MNSAEQYAAYPIIGNAFKNDRHTLSTMLLLFLLLESSFFCEDITFLTALTSLSVWNRQRLFKQHYRMLIKIVHYGINNFSTTSVHLKVTLVPTMFLYIKFYAKVYGKLLDLVLKRYFSNTPNQY